MIALMLFVVQVRPTVWPHPIQTAFAVWTAEARTEEAVRLATLRAWERTTPAAPWPWPEQLETPETPTSVPTALQSVTPIPIPPTATNAVNTPKWTATAGPAWHIFVPWSIRGRVGVRTGGRQ